MDWSIGSGLRVGGHRGAAGSAPENTMASFRRAADAGVDYLELDVRLTRDGRAVVFHDDTTARTTGEAGTIEDRPLEEVRRLDAGGWFAPGFAGELVPTLDEVLVFLAERPDLGATIEAKGSGTAVPIAAAALASPATARLSICSFDGDELRAAAKAAPALPRLLIVDRDRPGDDPLAAAIGAAATGVNVPLDWCHAALVERLHGAGLLVAGGTIDEDDGIARAVALGIDTCDSNRPEITVPARDRHRGPR
ncbi:MAG TPA: glycerophosphodiester phosphodiesterase family protein [Candidatus Limnocylindrales bacterium]|nr:glycerophosphodiester phosphodiesterase family protein [Candidatus Limnocylindrales bacterium]